MIIWIEIELETPFGYVSLKAVRTTLNSPSESHEWVTWTLFVSAVPSSKVQMLCVSLPKISAEKVIYYPV